MTTISRRQVAIGALAMATPRLATAQTRTLTAFGHRVHQNIMNGPGGDVTAAWRAVRCRTRRLR